MKSMKREAVGYLLPGLAGTVLFYVFPFVGGLSYAMRSDTFPPKFVGFANIAAVLQNAVFRTALWNTIAFSLVCAPIAVLLALVLACIFRSASAASRRIRAAMLVSYILPTAATISVWKILFGYNSAAAALVSHFANQRIDLLQSEWQMIPIIFLYIWRNAGFFSVLLIAAMQLIHQELYDFAEMEGASALQKHWHVTMPLISPTIIIVFIFSWTGTLKIFKEVYALSGGYPAMNVYTLQHYINNHLAKLNYATVTSASYIFAGILALVFGVVYRLESAAHDFTAS